VSRALVVSGPSRGIGAAVARLAGSSGYAVAVNCNNNAVRAAGAVESIKIASGHAIANQAEVPTEVGAKKLFDAVDRELGTLDALFNNAAPSCRQAVCSISRRPSSTGFGE